MEMIDTPIKKAGNTKLTYLSVNIGIENLWGNEMQNMTPNGIQNQREIYRYRILLFLTVTIENPINPARNSIVFKGELQNCQITK